MGWLGLWVFHRAAGTARGGFIAKAAMTIGRWLAVHEIEPKSVSYDIMRNAVKILLAAAWVSALSPALAETNSVPHVYPNGFMMVSTLGNVLYRTLDAKYQKVLDPNPVEVENMDEPVITPIAFHEGDEKFGEVSISAGYIDLVNHIAHAKAIDRFQPGCFQQYVVNLSRAGEKDAPPELPNIVDSRYWTEDVMNDQASIFNQIIGMTMALNLSHHYLGHYNKFSSQMLPGKLVPINSLLSQAEWEASVKAATKNALNAALGTDGPAALFEAIDKMPKRPSWTAFFVPPAADLKKLNKQIKTYEDQFFHGKLD